MITPGIYIFWQDGARFFARPAYNAETQEDGYYVVYSPESYSDRLSVRRESTFRKAFSERGETYYDFMTESEYVNYRRSRTENTEQ
ncbi:MAG: hypothetical protein WAX38_01975 [Minisyncoccia bacterium]